MGLNSGRKYNQMDEVDVMIIIIGKGIVDQSANLQCDCVSCHANTFGKDMNPILRLPYGKGQTEVFRLGHVN